MTHDEAVKAAGEQESYLKTRGAVNVSSKIIWEEDRGFVVYLNYDMPPERAAGGG